MTFGAIWLETFLTSAAKTHPLGPFGTMTRTYLPFWSPLIQRKSVLAPIKLAVGAWAFGAPDPEPFWRAVDRAEALGLDSLWLSDRVVSPPAGRGFVLDPLVALAGVAARTRRLTLGTSILVLPLRSPVVAAKEWATLDFLSAGRVLGLTANVRF